MGEYIWDSENDDRQYINEDEGEKESLQGYVIREAKKLLIDLIR